MHKLLDLHSTFGNLKSFTDFAEELKLKPAPLSLFDIVHKIDLEFRVNDTLPKTRLAACNDLIRAADELENAWDSLVPEPTLEWLTAANKLLGLRREQLQTCLDSVDVSSTQTSFAWQAWGVWQAWGAWSEFIVCLIPMVIQAPLFFLAVFAVFGGCKKLGGFLPHRLAHRECAQNVILFLVVFLTMLFVYPQYVCFLPAAILNNNPQLFFFLLTVAVRTLSSSYWVRALGVMFASQVVYNPEYEGVKYMILEWIRAPSWAGLEGIAPLSPFYDILDAGLVAVQSMVESLNWIVHLSPSYFYQQLKHHFLTPMPVMVEAPLKIFYESAPSFAARTKEHELYAELHKLALVKWNELSIFSLTVLVNAAHSFNVWRQHNVFCTSLLTPLLTLLEQGAVLQAWWHAQIVWKVFITPLLAPFCVMSTKVQQGYALLAAVVLSHTVSNDDREKSKTLLLRLASKTDFINSYKVWKVKNDSSTYLLTPTN